jgi:hypothetical protein
MVLPYVSLSLRLLARPFDLIEPVALIKLPELPYFCPQKIDRGAGVWDVTHTHFDVIETCLITFA